MTADDPELEAIRKRTMEAILKQSEAAPAASAASTASSPAPGKPITVTDATFEAVAGEHRVLVLDCWAPWCGPCRQVAPVVDDLAREMRGHVTFGKLNVDENPQTAQAFGVRSIPTLLVFVDGTLQDTIVGALPKHQLASRIRPHVRRSGGTPGPRRV